MHDFKMREFNAVIQPSTKLFISVSSRPGGLGAFVYNSLFKKHGIDALYVPRSAPETAPVLIGAIKALGIRGCSVSMPLKALVLPLLDEVSDEARDSGSVNTILQNGGVLRGFNTDSTGISEALRGDRPKSAVIFGTGATAGSALTALRSLGVERIRVTGRSASSIADFSKKRNVPAEESAADKFDLLLNATPASFGEPNPGILKLIDRASSVFDVALQSKSWISEAAAAGGKRVLTGFDMYVPQARRQFEIYTGIAESVDEVRRLAAEFLSKNP